MGANTHLSRLFPAEQARAFTDAVVAIAMTLLILPLMDSAASLKPGESLSDWWAQQQSQLVSFLLSFVLIAMFWLQHHRLFQRVKLVDAWLLRITMGWLLGIVWLPVATALSGRLDSDDRGAKAIYIGSLALVALLALAVRLWLRAHPQLHDLSPDEAAGGLAMNLSMLTLFVLSSVLAVVVPGSSYFPLFLMFGVGVVAHLYRRLLPSPTAD